MKITVWDIFKYIYKWKILILAFVAICLFGASVYVKQNQTYSGEIIIRYTDSNAKSGSTPDGSKLDVYEIIAPNIISGAISDLNIKSSVEAIRSRIVITPIIPDEVIELKKSKTKEGEEYDYNATDYSVRYTVGSDKNGAYARDVIDAIIKNYSIYYSEKYLNNGVLPEVDFDIDTNAHDYLEVAEIMDSKAKDTIKYLESREGSNPDFRSPITGMSFLDLKNQYKVIKNFDLPALFANILNSQITNSKELLVKKYQYRKEQYILQNKSKVQESNVALSLMEDFVNSNKSVPNSYNQNNQNNSSDFNSNNIYVNDKLNRTKTTYDKLVDSYVLDGVNAGNLLIDSTYCDNIINAFSKPLGGNVDASTAKNKADSDIVYIKNKLAKLYKLTDISIRDFNNLSASNHIVSLSGINILNGISLNFYLLIAFVIGVLLGMVFAIAIEIILGLKKEIV